MKNRFTFRILATAFTVAMLLAGAAKSASAQQICGNSNSGALGNSSQYLFEGDQWNSSFTGTYQCETITNGSSVSMSYSGNAFDDTTNTPADYPDFMYGCFQGTCTSNTSLPIQVSSLTNYSITSGETVTEPSGDNNDMAYDIWFNQTSTAPSGQNTTGTELMIWVQHNGVAQPIGSQTSTFTSGGITWAVWTGTNTGNCGGCTGAGSQVISFVNESGDGATSGTTYSLNLNDFFSEALSLGEIQSSWYLTTIEFGTEIWIGGPGLQVNSYFVDVASGGSGSGGGGTNGSAAELPTNAPVNLINQGSNLCLDMGGTTNGAALQQWACGDGGYSTQANQEWEFVPGTASGYYYIKNVNAPSEYWNVDGNDTNAGTMMQMYQLYTGAANEEFKGVSQGNGYYEFVGQQSGLCMNVAGSSTANGAQMQINTCGGWASELFRFAAPAATLTTGTAYSLVNKNSGNECLDMGGTTNGAVLQQYACANGSYSTQTNQQWEFQSAGYGNYYVQNVRSPGEYWNVDGNETASGSLMQAYQLYNGATNEEWTPVSMGNGYYEFVGVQSGLCLDTPGGSTANGVQLDIYICNGTGAQSFQLATP